MFLYQLTRPFSYLAIKPRPLKSKIDVVLPLVFGCAMAVVCLFGKQEINMWGDDGLVLRINSVLQILPGFYIAALAAIIALGHNKRLDELIMGTPTPFVTMRTQEIYGRSLKELTRRHFLCLLFSYLAAISLLLCLATPILISFIPLVKSVLANSYVAVVLYFVFTALFFFLVAQITLVTLFGLYYISDKMFS